MSVVQTVSVQCLNDAWNDGCCNLLVVRVDDSGEEMMVLCGTLSTVQRRGLFTFSNVYVGIKRGSRTWTKGGHVLAIV